MKVELSIRASHLKNARGVQRWGLSDPFVIVTKTIVYNEQVRQQYDIPRAKTTTQILGRSETIPSNLNPKWKTSFTVDYDDDDNDNDSIVKQEVTVEIFDEIPNRSSNNSNNNSQCGKRYSYRPMGRATFDIAELLAANGNSMSKPVRGGGTVYCHAQKVFTEEEILP